MNSRQENNIKISKYLLELSNSEAGKYLRFNQMLFNLGINEFSEETLERKVTNLELVDSKPNTLKDKYNEESSLTFQKLNKIEI